MKELIDLQRVLNIPKDQKGHNYDYRKVDDILSAVKKEAPDNVYLVMTDDIVNVGDFNYIKSTVTIYNGKESVSASSAAREGKLASQSDPQISGSCSTYARKKALEGLFALDDNNDPDSGKGVPDDEPLATIGQLKELDDFCNSSDAKTQAWIRKYKSPKMLRIDAEGMLKNLRAKK